MIILKPVTFLSSIFVLASITLSAATASGATPKVVKVQDDVDVSDVVFIAQMTRHGSRAPLSSVVPDQKWIIEAGLGELTIVGERQHYNLGMNLRNKYIKLFPTKMTKDEFYIQSTAFNRTLNSAFSHMNGFFG